MRRFGVRIPTSALESSSSQKGFFFAAYQNHIGFYPTPNGIKQFESEFGKYKFSKGAVQFPLDDKLPLKLIIKMVKFRAKEDLAKFKKK